MELLPRERPRIVSQGSHMTLTCQYIPAQRNKDYFDFCKHKAQGSH